MPSAEIIRFESRHPRVFTEHERFLDALREALLTSKVTYKAIATKANVASSTVGNIASGKTRWPRHTTLFPLLKALGKTLAMVDA
jgi:transcriptional regulator with XRE-family HTH domain